MGRLIYADELKKDVLEHNSGAVFAIDFIEQIDAQPTVDAVEVVHGEWIPTKDDNKKRCSKCDVIHLIAQYPHGQANYCPNCGAKMNGGDKE